jgi:hypothetical protein
MRKLLLIVIALSALGLIAFASFSKDFVDRAAALYGRVFEGRAIEPPIMKPPPSPRVPKLPRDPLARQAAVESLLRLRPDRRFLLAAAEVAGAASAEPRYENGRWMVTVAGKEVGSVSELPDFGEMLEVLLPLARTRTAAENLQGPPATGGRALRNEEESLPALRAAQKSWSAGPHTRAALHQAAAAAAALAFYMVDLQEVADGLAAHALALAALDAAAGNDARGIEAVVAAALDYDRAAEELLREVQGEDALKHFLSRDVAQLEKDGRLPDATPADRYLHLRLLVQLDDLDGVARWLEDAPPDERLSTAAVGQVARQRDMQAFGPAVFALPALIGARVESASLEARGGPFAEALAAASSSAAVTLRLDKDIDLPWRIARAARKLDAGAAGPLLRASDAGDFFIASLAAALWRQSEYYEFHQGNRAAAQEFARKLGNQTDPALHELQVVVSAIAANDETSAYAALAEPGHLGENPAALLLKRISRTATGESTFIGTILAAAPRFDSRVLSRIRWGQIRSTHLLERAAPRKLYQSVQRDAPAAHPEMASWLAWSLHDVKAFKAMVLQKSLPFTTRRSALDDYVALSKPAAAEEALRAFAGSAPDRYQALLPLLQFLRKAGKPAAARELAMKWLAEYEETSPTLEAAFMRCEASHLDLDMERWAAGLEVIQPALHAYPLCALDFAAAHSAMLGHKREANQFVEAMRARYRNMTSTAEAAWVYWLESDFAAAAGVLAAPISASDFRWIIGVRFANAFVKRPAADTKPAVQALLTAHVSPFGISELGQALAERGLFEQAFLVGSALDFPTPERWMQVVRTASALRHWKGDEAAREWMGTKIPNPTPPMVAYNLSLFAYREDLDEQVLALPEPQEPGLSDDVWVLRAASLARLGRHGRPETRKLLQAHFAQARAGRAFQLGRYLLGQLPETELPGLVTDRATSCAVPYFAGVKAESDGRTDDATVWYADSMLGLCDGDTHSRWAYNALRRIRDNERTASTEWHPTRY